VRRAGPAPTRVVTIAIIIQHLLIVRRGSVLSLVVGRGWRLQQSQRRHRGQRRLRQGRRRSHEQGQLRLQQSRRRHHGRRSLQQSRRRHH
jgi:hypothetical protein